MKTQILIPLFLVSFQLYAQCTLDECGPPPMMPNYLCYDGITIAGPGDCIESISGECFWEIIECPTIIGYLRENEISDCQDECSQFFIEPEVFNQFISTLSINDFSRVASSIYSK